MFAVIESGGKQYRVEPEQVINLEKLEGHVGEKITFDTVLMVKTESELYIGRPYLAGARVESEILEQKKAKKIIVFKKKKRKGYHKEQGHRQFVTRVKIIGIQAPAAS